VTVTDRGGERDGETGSEREKERERKKEKGREYRGGKETGGGAGDRELAVFDRASSLIQRAL